MKNRLTKSLLFSLGVVSVALGVVGAFLPVLPTTPFILLAAWCFLKSSEKAHQWLYRQPLLGKALRNWEQNRAISRPTKRLALSMIAASLVFMWVKIDHLWLKGAVTILLVSVSVFIATRNEGGE